MSKKPLFDLVDVRKIVKLITRITYLTEFRVKCNASYENGKNCYLFGETFFEEV